MKKIYMILEIVSMVVVITIMCCPDNERRSLMVDFDNTDEGRWAGRERDGGRKATIVFL